MYIGRAGITRGSAGSGSYSFRSFRRAANQPTDRPTRSRRGRTGMLRDSVRACRLGRVGWEEGDSPRLANGSRGARAPETRLLVPRHSKRRHPRARRPGRGKGRRRHVDGRRNTFVRFRSKWTGVMLHEVRNFRSNRDSSRLRLVSEILSRCL